MRGRWLVGAILLLATAAAGEPLPPGLPDGHPAEVTEVLDGETARLAGGRELRLAAILAPRAALPRTGQPSRADPELARLAAASRTALASMIEGRSVVLHVSGPPRDRHGREIAQVAGPGGEWVQAALVSQGLVRVQTTAENSAEAETLLRLEGAARDARLGLWRHEMFRVRKPGELGPWIDTFQIVEGTVQPGGERSAGHLVIAGNGGRLILTLSARTRSEWRGSGRTVESLGGQPVRVRGWIRWRSGPVIDVSHTAQIERLSPP